MPLCYVILSESVFCLFLTCSYTFGSQYLGCYSWVQGRQYRIRSGNTGMGQVVQVQGRQYRYYTGSTATVGIGCIRARYWALTLLGIGQVAQLSIWQVAQLGIGQVVQVYGSQYRQKSGSTKVSRVSEQTKYFEHVTVTASKL